MGYGNQLRTGILFVVMLALFAGVGYVVAAYFGSDPGASMIAFLALAAVINLVSYFWSDRLVLAAYRAKEVTESEAPGLHRVVGRVAAQAGLPKPRVYLIPTDTPNAFATGRDPAHGKVAFTRGILRALDEDELEGVAAHEMGHIHNRDILIMSVAATIAAAIGFAARWLFWGSLFGGGRDRGGIHPAVLILVMLTAPLAALLVQLAISRSREYKADAAAARFTGKPRALARALGKLEDWNKRVPLEAGNPAHSSLFIVNPFRGGAFVSLFSTHPPMKERIRRLEALA